MHQQLQDYRPSIPDGSEEASQNFDKSLRTTYPMSIDQCQTIPEMDDSQLVGAPVAMLAADVDLATRESVNTVVPVEVRNDTKVAEINTGKRKRGRPPRIHGKLGPPLQPSPLASQRKKQDEEDVCFICFDGGSLVLCDRRGCPKAYHPACIKRDEAFFRSKAKWNCGWHICSSCQKASHYMCYTCPYSLCKGCTKDADYLCVRGNKGFCGTCMRTIMLIENITVGNQETVQVDFDDKTSWEYLFKVYWIYLKAKLSLTVDEITKAKNPWKGEELPKARNYRRGAGAVASKQELSIEAYHGNDNKASFSDSCHGNLGAFYSKRRKMEEELKLPNENSHSTAKSTVDQVKGLPEGSAWATKELLEFVAHMKNGDMSVLSQFDVQGLLLEYIKRNNLRDPHQKSQIVCDSRLINLFGRERLGHFEMLKLLEYHFLINLKSVADGTRGMGVADAVVDQAEASRNNDGQLVTGSDRKRKTYKKTDEKGEQITTNTKEYAAIDVHNINLLYLNRNLMENLMDDGGKFHEKVVGSFVRIRVSGGDQKQDVYRLVQVVGTSKVAESYKVGSRTTNVMLEILNLDKKEVISIDGISSQEFSEDECIRLRQSIECGFIKRLTVGDIQEKAMVLQAVKVSDWLEAEILRLNHLRDRASEKGHKKELRECVEKLELLKSPEERQRRLLETPNVHSDPNMNPSYESEEDAFESDKKKHGDRVRKINSGIGRKVAELNSSMRGCKILNNIGNRSEDLATVSERNREICTTFYVDRDGTTMIHEKASESAESQGGEIGLHSHNAPRNWVGPTGSVTCDWNGQAVVQSGTFSGVSSPVLPPLSTGRELLVNDTETDKLWHYQDPTGKIQGPFPMAQLRKWSESGLFPRDLRVWKMNESQDDSILLTDALVGRLHKEPSLPHNSYLSAQEVMVASDKDKKQDFVLQQSPDASFVDGKNADHSWKSVQSDASVHYKGNDEPISSNAWGSHSSSWTTAVDGTLPNNGQAQSSLQYGESSKGFKSSPDQSHLCSSLSSLPSTGKLCETPVVQVNKDHVDEKRISGLTEVNENSNKTSEGQNNISKSDEKRTDSESYSCQSQNWRPPTIKSSSSGLDSNSAFVSAAKSIETSGKNEETDFSDLPNPTPNQSCKDLKGQAAVNNQSTSSKLPVLDSGPSWSTASSLVVGGARLAEVAGEWSGYSPAPVKPLVEEWDSNHVSASSQRPADGGGDHAATPTPESGQLTHSSPTDPVIDPSGWQSIVPEPTEFCSLVDESVSDLLAEVEAMESLGGLPSPTSKMRCDEELTRGSDDDCFSPVEGFSPAPDPGKSDAFSSTSDIQIPSQLTIVSEPLQLCQMPSQPSIIDQLFGMSPMPSQMTVAEESIQVSHTPPRSTSTDELLEKPLEISQRPSQSTSSDEPPGLSLTDVPNPHKSFSGHSSTSPEVDGDSKPSHASVSRLKKHSETHPPASSTGNQGGSGSDIHPITPATVGQWEAGSDIQRPTPSNKDTSWGAPKGNENTNRGGVGQGNTNMVWGTGHGTAQQHARTNLATSTGNSGSWGSQPRYGGDRYSGPRDHRNHFQGSRDRDSGFGRDRSSWNKQPFYGAGNGGSSYRPPPKGQRVCKFYESGYCKKGASCSYLHPS